MNTSINNFIFETVVISPITDIIVKLNQKEFRDCDIDWLNGKLKSFTDLALQTLGKQIDVGDAVGGTMNDHNRNRFISYFTTILNYFKSFN
jgi:hypothetical protein